jgi:nitroreductase
MLPLLQKRRSIRVFQKRPIEQEKIDLLVEAVLRSPSSRGRSPWEFVFVKEAEVISKLSRAKASGSEFLAKAPLAVVVAADPEVCDVWVEDCAIAAIILQLTAESLGLGSCWAQIRERLHGEGRSAEDYLKETLALPSRYRVLSVIGIGYPGEEKAGRPKEALPYQKIHTDRFGSS